LSFGVKIIFFDDCLSYGAGYFYLTKLARMKKLFFLPMLFAGAIAVDAQIKSDTSLLRRSTKVNPGVVQQQATPSLMSPKTISKAALGTLSKEKDLAIDQFQVMYEPMNKRYKLKCRVFNAGTTDIDLSLIAYSAHGSPNTLSTAVSQSDPGFFQQSGPVELNIPYDLETELPPGVQTWVNGRPLQLMSLGRELVVTTRDPNAAWVFSSLSNKILKPGDAAYAIAYDNAVWDSKVAGAGIHRIYTLKIDPLNKIGDQNLDNNIITYTMTNYY
jgi:hypothetical protein